MPASCTKSLSQGYTAEQVEAVESSFTLCKYIPVIDLKEADWPIAGQQRSVRRTRLRTLGRRAESEASPPDTERKQELQEEREVMALSRWRLIETGYVSGYVRGAAMEINVRVSAHQEENPWRVSLRQTRPRDHRLQNVFGFCYLSLVSGTV